MKIELEFNRMLTTEAQRQRQRQRQRQKAITIVHVLRDIFAHTKQRRAVF